MKPPQTTVRWKRVGVDRYIAELPGSWVATLRPDATGKCIARLDVRGERYTGFNLQHPYASAANARIGVVRHLNRAGFRGRAYVNGGVVS